MLPHRTIQIIEPYEIHYLSESTFAEDMEVVDYFCSEVGLAPIYCIRPRSFEIYQPSAISTPAIRKTSILFTETQLPTGGIPASGILAEALGSPGNKAPGKGRRQDRMLK
jgi:hypothetical protein